MCISHLPYLLLQCWSTLCFHCSSIFLGCEFLSKQWKKHEETMVLRFFWPFFKRNLKKITRNIEGCLEKNLQFGQLSPIDARFFGDGHQWCCSRTLIKNKQWIALSSISNLICRHIFKAQIYETTQLYQLLHPLCTWNFLSKLKTLEWLHSKSFFISSIFAISYFAKLLLNLNLLQINPQVLSNLRTWLLKKAN